jgi:chorismate synthase
MAGSSFGKHICLTTFGESHGAAIGGIIDGFPSNFEVNLDALQAFVNKRKPGQSKLVTQRQEDDQVQFLSGIFEGKTLGTPIAFMIPNKDAKSKDYSHLKDSYRPSHADFTFDKKFGHRDYRGGGRSSARETVSRVVAGGLAIQFLETKGIQIQAWVDQVGPIRYFAPSRHLSELFHTETEIESSPTRCPDKVKAAEMEELILSTKKAGDSIGGCISCRIVGLPVGLGEPVFDKLNAKLAQAMVSINAVKGIEFGEGFACVEMNGSAHNDEFLPDGTTKTNFSAGIQGGISNGLPVDFRVAFKPVATIMHDQKSINSKGEEVIIEGKGRHDACVVPRAVPIVEAMASLVVLDFLEGFP